MGNQYMTCTCDMLEAPQPWVFYLGVTPTDQQEGYFCASEDCSGWLDNLLGAIPGIGEAGVASCG